MLIIVLLSPVFLLCGLLLLDSYEQRMLGGYPAPLPNRPERHLQAVPDLQDEELPLHSSRLDATEVEDVDKRSA